jgi:hypothetical protein
MGTVTPPAKRSRLNQVVTGLIAVGLVGSAVGIWYLTETPADEAPKTRTAPAAGLTSHTVIYEADGGTARGLRTVSYTIQTDSGGTSQGETNLPMKNRNGGTGLVFTGFRTGDFVYLSVQNKDAAGDVTCRIRVDGTVISENTSSGGYTIATCKGTVPAG